MNDDKGVMERLGLLMRESGISQIEIANALKISAQAVNNWFSRKKIGVKAAREICLKYGYSLEWLLSGTGSKKINDGNLISSNFVITEADPGDEKQEEFIQVPMLNIKLSAGNGVINEDESKKYTLPFRAYSLSKRGINPRYVSAVYVTGDSMYPRMGDGDVVAINLQETEIRDGKIYAIRIGDVQKIKTLIQNSDGTITLRSFNILEFKDETITKSQIETGEFKVIGRVFWISSMI